MATIKSKAEEMALKAKGLESFKAFDLAVAKDRLETMLSHIGDKGMFSEYTKHDISHIDGMLELVDYIVPEEVKNALTSADWLMIVLSVYFHDLGMLITNSEWDDRANNSDFSRFCSSHGKKLVDCDELEQRQLFQNFVRENHGNRICEWIGCISSASSSANPVITLLTEILSPIEEDFRNDLGLICKTHGEELSDYLDKLKTNQPYEQSKDSNVNLLYAAAVLRTADLLHVNSERTPRTDYILISPKNVYSRREWGFQKSIKQIRPRTETNKENLVDPSIPIHRFEMIGTFKDVDEYSRFLEYFDYAQSEIHKTYEICKESQRVHKNEYLFPWDALYKEDIETVNFEKYKLRFELDHDKIFKLLIGHTLYSHANVVLRELTQNAIDAVRLMSSNEKTDSSAYKPMVKVEWNSTKRTLTVRDNGTGMNTDIVKNYLLKVGISRYRTEEFITDHPDFHSISHFGIGILTCFMISEDIDIITRYYNEEKAHSLHIRNHQGEYFIKNNVESDEILEGEHGSTFVLKVRDDVIFDKIESDLRNWILFPECIITLKIDDGDEVVIGFEDEEKAMNAFLKKYGFADNPKYKLARYEDGGVTVISLLYLNETYNVYTLCKAHDMLNDMSAPIGICIEGVRVSNETPGYLNRKYISLVNCRGKGSPSTNVARDRLEEGSEYNHMCQTIYKAYLEVVSNLMKEIGRKYTDYWATFEAVYLIEELCDENGSGGALASETIFEKCLKVEKCMIIDDGEKSEVCSFSMLPNDVWTIESQAYLHAVQMIQDIQRCNASPLSITSGLQGGSALHEHSRCVYADFNSANYVSNLFLKSYQIQEIAIYVEHRKMEIKWSKGAGLWHILDVSFESWRSMYNTKLFIQKLSADINLTNQNGASVICTKFGILLLKGNHFNTYFDELLSKGDPAYETSIEILSILFARKIRMQDCPEDYIDKFFDSDFNTLGDDIWKYLDKDRVKECMNDKTLKKVDFSKFYHNTSDYDDYPI